MQINELLLKNFGKFHDRQINLEEGINLIHGENESGKSTIHTFIKGMLFGIERGRGRAAQNDTFSIYEPWDNPNYYSGTLKFASGGKHFRIERNFDKYSKKAELVCIEDGEVLSVEDGDLRMLLGEMNVDRHEPEKCTDGRKYGDGIEKLRDKLLYFRQWRDRSEWGVGTTERQEEGSGK